MKLSDPERLILMNQFRILARLFPDEAKSYGEFQTILERGYEPLYSLFADVLHDSPITEEESEEFINTMNMFRAIKSYVRSGGNTDRLNYDVLEFRGYDGNSEGRMMAYAQFFCQHDGGRYDDLVGSGFNFNSHHALRGAYSRMVAAWRKSADKHKLTRADIDRIVAVGW